MAAGVAAVAAVAVVTAVAAVAAAVAAAAALLDARRSSAKVKQTAAPAESMPAEPSAVCFGSAARGRAGGAGDTGSGGATINAPGAQVWPEGGCAPPPPTRCGIRGVGFGEGQGRPGQGREPMGLALCYASVSPPGIVADAAHRTRLGQGDRDIVPPTPATWPCSHASAQEWLSWN